MKKGFAVRALVDNLELERVENIGAMTELADESPSLAQFALEDVVNQLICRRLDEGNQRPVLDFPKILHRIHIHKIHEMGLLLKN